MSDYEIDLKACRSRQTRLLEATKELQAAATDLAAIADSIRDLVSARMTKQE